MKILRAFLQLSFNVRTAICTKNSSIKKANDIKIDKKDIPKRYCYHHQIERGPFAPSLTPFAVKLETYLRMANIPYQNVHDDKKSKKNKFTWIEYNVEDIADSESCIEYLNDKLGVDLDKNLTHREKGIATAFQKMIEENTYWTIVLDRWFYDEKKGAYKAFKASFLTQLFLRRLVRKWTYAAGSPSYYGYRFKGFFGSYRYCHPSHNKQTRKHIHDHRALIEIIERIFGNIKTRMWAMQ